MSVLHPDVARPPLAVPRFYYSDTFAQLIEENRDDILKSLLDHPREFRQRTLRPLLTGNDRVKGSTAWDALALYLDAVEGRLAELIGEHSPAYWLHLYRRISPRLSPDHQGKVDHNTTVLVRRIAELAFFKHGHPRRDDDVGNVTQTRIETFLGGHFYRVMGQRLGSKLAARKRYEELKRAPQAVLIDFRHDDLVRVFEIEGFAYEYWRTSAAMRSVGKGSVIKWDDDESWIDYVDDEFDPILFDLYDTRINNPSRLHTLLGTWIGFGEVSDSADRLFYAGYNPDPQPEIYSVWNSHLGEGEDGLAALNFHIGHTSVQEFMNAHSFMENEFERKHGVALRSVIQTVWALSSLSVLPHGVLTLEDDQKRKERMTLGLTNLHFRGYSVLMLNLEALPSAIIRRSALAGLSPDLSHDEAERAVRFIGLHDTARTQISLWSGGKRPLLVSQGKSWLLFDLAGVIPFLVTLFFGVREKTGAKGMVFEDAVRQSLKKKGFDVCYSGEMLWADGTKREVDAALRVGNDLILIECVSSERPVDFELSKPGVFNKRTEILQEKLNQISSLHSLVLKSKVGVNFDFSWAEQITWRLVSPFVEFATELTEEWFDADGLPRVLSADELMDSLDPNSRLHALGAALNSVRIRT